MKLKADRATLLKALAHVQSVVERRNTIPILANVMLAVRDGKLTLTATDMEIAIVEDVPASTTRNGSCTAPAATLYEIVRKLPDGAEVELDHPGGDAQLALRAGRYSTSLGGAADRGLSLDDRRRAAAPVQSVGAGAARPDRSHPVRHQHRGDALLPQRHLPACRGKRRHAGAARRRDRWTSAGPGGGAVAGRRRLDAGRDHPAQDGERIAQAAGRGHRQRGGGAVRHPHPVPRRCGAADQQADRRHVPGIRAGDPARQRQGAARRQEGLRRCGRPGCGDLRRTVAPGEAVAGARSAGAVGGKPGAGHGDRGTGFRSRHL